ncbi:hypothetical protein EYF80_047499 [Liparis tanakae]|uniref:Uncharacterized protein n=1 Tax=Liparis tanakae TaxID=230148 RepID=A0A4Z2FMG9_9TELE|nr:hypothetical protein EYF80_047499 [Liparis tanakae]
MAAVRAFMLSMLSVELLNPDWMCMSPRGPSSSIYQFPGNKTDPIGNELLKVSAQVASMWHCGTLQCIVGPGLGLKGVYRAQRCSGGSS